MNGLDHLSVCLGGPSEPKLMAHGVCGYPDLETSLGIFRALADSGADIIEAQLPFSDPSADGPLIVEANHAALRSGASTEACLEMLGRLRATIEAPIIVMSYLNPLFSYGIARIVGRMAELALDGLIVPDYPDDEPELELDRLAEEAALAFVPLIAPSTDLDRATRLAARVSSPLLYAVLRSGVTGRATEIDAATADRLAHLRDRTGKFVGAGFGIRTRAQVEALRGKADCAIVGSAVLAAIMAALKSGRDPAKAAGAFIRGLVPEGRAARAAAKPPSLNS
jgi:tryptophan synthase alpha chain